ncbi:hypothetical protein [Streptomyces durhamensis]|uniref:hypothetical protein n=1 Tax=Streptomyces durhamensis TaxID=68194 RepID=UPI0004CCAA62|nr:hypothetical protein [Streptomyces durhamensis]
MTNLFVPRPAGPVAADSSPPCSCTPGSGQAGTAAATAAAVRFGPTHALILLLCFLALGSGLFLAGTPLDTVFALLSGCGAIGAATLAAAGGGRRLAAVFVEAAVRSGTGK